MKLALVDWVITALLFGVLIRAGCYGRRLARLTAGPSPIGMLCLFLAIASTLPAQARKPIVEESFERYPGAAALSNSLAGKSCSISDAGYAVPLNSPALRKHGAISFWYRGAIASEMLKRVVLNFNLYEAGSCALYTPLNADGHLYCYQVGDQFWGDPLDWHSCTVTWNETGRASLYHDGCLVVTRPIKIDSEPVSLNIGPLKGVSIDEVRVFDEFLSHDEARELHSEQAVKLALKTVSLVPAAQPAPAAEAQNMAREPWFGFSRGKDHSVPPPWTPVRATAKVFRCWDRDYAISNLGFSSIRSGGEDLLSRPAGLLLTDERGARIETGSKQPPRITQLRSDSAEYRSSATLGDLAVNEQITAEYDGFIKWRIEIKPRKKTVISGLSLRMPLRPEIARYMNVFGSWRSVWNTEYRVPIVSSGKSIWYGFEPYAWVGNEDRGICLMLESEKNCLWADRSRVIGLIPDGDGFILQLNLINGRALLDPKTAGAGLVYELGIMVTPAKPPLPDFRNLRVHGIIGENGVGPRNTVVQLPWFWHRPWPSFNESDTQISDMTAKIEKAVAEKTIKDGYVCPYMNFQKYGLQTEGEEPLHHSVFADSWSVQLPADILTKKHDINGKWSMAANVCAAAPHYDDFFIREFCEFMQSHPKLKGIYIDETFSFCCTSEAHGCGWRTAGGTLLGRYPVFANRERRKRWYKVAKSYRPDFLFWTHDSPFSKQPSAVYSDISSLGETERYSTDDPLDTLSLNVLKTEYLRQMGVPQFLLPQLTRNNNLAGEVPTRRLAMLLALHDIQVWNLWANRREMDKIWALMNEFGMDETVKFIPYWSKAPYAVSSDRDVLASAYVGAGRAMVIVYNTTKEARAVEVHVAASLPVTRAYPEEIKVSWQEAAGTIWITLPPGESALLILGGRQGD